MSLALQYAWYIVYNKEIRIYYIIKILKKCAPKVQPLTTKFS